jgi:hypothetical protein
MKAIKKTLLGEEDPVDTEACYEAYVALRDSYGTDPDPDPPAPGPDPDPPAPGPGPDPDPPAPGPDPRGNLEKQLIKAKTSKNKTKNNRLKTATPEQLLATFKEECAATIKKEACEALILKFDAGTALDADYLKFPDVCGVADPNAGGTGNSGFFSTKASILLMIIGLALTNIYFE